MDWTDLADRIRFWTLLIIGTLMYLANCSCCDIPFSINLLVRYNFALTRRHWNSVKHVFRYFHGTLKKSLPTVTFKKLIDKIEMCQLKDFCPELEAFISRWRGVYLLGKIIYFGGNFMCVLFFLTRFLSHKIFPNKVLMRQLYTFKIICFKT